MLTAILREHGRTVLTNPSGSNFTRGVISAMLGQLPLTGRSEADVAVFELDEAHALKFAEVVTPTHVLVLNVAADQVDRFADVRATAGLLATLASQASAGVVLNRDDALVAPIGGGLAPDIRLRHFGVDESLADRLPALPGDESENSYAIPSPGPDDGLLRGVGERDLEIRFGSDEAGRIGPLTLRQPGLAPMLDATAATTMARLLLGDAFDATLTERALSTVAPAFGRGEVIDVDGHPLELVLVKNTAGFTIALAGYAALPAATMIAMNNQPADGADVSWFADVDFTSLRGTGVAVVSGSSADEMALRLATDEVPTASIEPDPIPALDAFIAAHPAEPKRVFCSYTAMMSLRHELAQRHGLPTFADDPA